VLASAGPHLGTGLVATVKLPDSLGVFRDRKYQSQRRKQLCETGERVACFIYLLQTPEMMIKVSLMESSGRTGHQPSLPPEWERAETSYSAHFWRLAECLKWV
jgi:hypothetical protein